MSAGPVQTNYILVPVPCGASVDWGRQPKPPPYQHHKSSRERWGEQRSIPQRPAVDRELIERMREIAKRTIADAKPTIEAMLRAAYVDRVIRARCGDEVADQVISVETLQALLEVVEALEAKWAELAARVEEKAAA
jgi:hypothetical protein